MIADPAGAVILAAGAGSRLGELGRRHSKAMVPIAARPLIDWVIEALFAAGVRRIVVVRHPSDDELAAFLHRHDASIGVVDQPTRQGIADALLCAWSAVADETAFVACACDSVFAAGEIAQLIKRGRRYPGSAGVGVLEMGAAATRARSAVRVENERVTELVEKPPPETAASTLVAAPLYWIPRELGPHLRSAGLVGGERHVSTALNDFVRQGGTVWATPISRRVEITTAADVERAAEELRTLLAEDVTPPGSRGG